MCKPRRGGDVKRETTLRKLAKAIERQKKLGFNEKGDPLNLEAVDALDREVRIRLAAEEMSEREYPEAIC
jgi:hypothetical protein